MITGKCIPPSNNHYLTRYVVGGQNFYRLIDAQEQQQWMKKNYPYNDRSMSYEWLDPFLND